MEKIMIISTGGTIASVDKGDGAVPDAETAKNTLAPAVDFLHGCGIECEVVEPFGAPGIDSSDMSPVEWEYLTMAVSHGCAAGIKKFLITHGTDTMAYSASWLSLFAENVVVVLTGSQRTPYEDGFDGTDNLLGAARLLCEADEGVFVYFAGEIFKGAYVHKEDSSCLCAYVRTGDGRQPPFFALPHRRTDWREAARRLAIVYAHPAFLGGFPSDAKILIVCGYGSGNIPRRLHRELEAAYRGGVRPIVIAASSCAMGEKDPVRYGGVGMAALSEKKFAVFGQGNYSIEFLVTLSYFALLSDAEAPEKILGLCLKKF